jgi:hypothetical protein
MNFQLFDPNSVLSDQKILMHTESPVKKGKYVYFVKQENYLIIYAERMHTYPRTGKQKLIANQIEIPLPGVRWFVDVIEQKFFKAPEDGGLPADKISYSEFVEGEKLHVIRSMNAGGGYPGYDLTNLNRYSYISPESKDPQEVSFADPWLFDMGLMDFFKDTAAKYEAGTL